MNERDEKPDTRTVRVDSKIYDELARRADELDTAIGKIVELAWQAYKGEPEEIELEIGCESPNCKAKLKKITLERAKEKLKELRWNCPSHITKGENNEGETWGF